MAVTITLPPADEAIRAGEDPLFGWKLLAEQAVFGYLRKHAEAHLPGDALQPPLRIEGQERDWLPADFAELLGEYRDAAEKAATKSDLESLRERGGRIKLEPLADDAEDSHAAVWTATIHLPAKRPGAGEKEQTARYPVRLPASLVPKAILDMAVSQSDDNIKVKRGRKAPTELPYRSGPSRPAAKVAKPKRKIKRH